MHTFDWIVENRVLYVRNEGKLSGDELETLSEKFGKMVDEAVAPLHIIEDDRELEGITGFSVDAVRKAFKAVDFDKLGWTIAIVPDELEEVSDILGKTWEIIADVKYERVATVPEALEFLAEHDATLPDRSEWELALA